MPFVSNPDIETASDSVIEVITAKVELVKVKSVDGAMLNKSVAAGVASGLHFHHSSMRSLINLPGILRGVNYPLGSTIFPSVFRLHFPSFRYD